MRTQRSVIDYALARRATLADLFAGRLSTMDVCDAHPYLLRAAKYHGERTDTDCPVCRREPLTQVIYVYGDELKDAAGQVRASAELLKMARDYAELTVYVVEVCRSCGWNHLTTSYQIGTNGLRTRRVRRAPDKTEQSAEN
ncbi:MAG TPA: DUF5318 family protein [Mycobacteriales bacterium]|jgi:hypothetical protein|nr:DUF5318 family protein [Mycobacteriales bacterium]